MTRRVLVARLDSAGDVLLCGPAVRAIWESLYGVNGMTVNPAKAAIDGTTPPAGIPTFMRDGTILPPSAAKED